ncbi:MAG: ribonuclease III [Rhodospirillales bacterium]
MNAGIEKLESNVGYDFGDRELLVQALTHASRSLRPDERLNSNERLEFLGDRVLALVISELLYEHYPADEEGSLSRRLNALVRRETLAEIASDLGLASHIIMSKGEADQGGRQNPSLMADAMEALIAAVYLDGGMDAARTLIRRFWLERVEHGPAEPPKDAKTRLQEWSQAEGLGLPTYKVVDRTGPPHAPEFRVAVVVQGFGENDATGSSKQRAEQAAADAMLTAIEENRDGG